MAMSVIFEEQVEVPLDIRSLADFRRWALSDGFPERGRIDYIGGRIEVDMSPEDLYCHGTLKTEIARVLSTRVKVKSLGQLFIDCTRISSPQAELSAEPDIVLIQTSSLKSGNILQVPKASGEKGRYVELEGAADLVVEIVSDSSAKKDTQRLPAAYFAAGVREFWLADSRGEALLFQIHRRGADRFEPVGVDAEGFQYSEVLDCGFSLERQWSELEFWTYDLLEKES